MEQWKNNFRRAFEMGFDQYCASLSSEILGPDLPAQLPYLTMHAALKEALHQLPNATIRMMPSVGTAAQPGPFYFLESYYKGAAEDAMGRGILDLPQHTFENVSFIKLRGADRKYLAPLDTSTGYLGTVLKAALPPGYTGTNYMPINPLSVGQWIGIALGSSVLIGAVMSLATALLVCWVLKRRQREQAEGLLRTPAKSSGV